VLLIDALTFLKQNIPETNYPIPNGILKVAEGIITWFKVLQRDCPSFIANYYFDFVNLIPERCKQLLNIVLSAVPTQFENQPDPLEDDILIEGKGMKNMPEIWSNFD